MGIRDLLEPPENDNVLEYDEFTQMLQNGASAFDLIRFDGCPCFVLWYDNFKAKGYCWRVGHGEHSNLFELRQEDGGCCVHIEGDRDLGLFLRNALDSMDWYGGWEIKWENDE